MSAFNSLETNNQAWDNKLFSVPAGVQVDDFYDLAVSDPIANPNNMGNIDVFVNFDAMNPNATVQGLNPSFIIVILLEEEISPGNWSIMAESFGQRFNTMAPGSTEAKFIVQTKNPSDQGQPFSTFKGFKWFVNENPSDTMRVRITVTDQNPTGNTGLVSATVTGAYRLY